MVSMNQARLKEVMSAGGAAGCKGPYKPDGELTDDTYCATRRGGDETSADDKPSSSHSEPASGPSSSATGPLLDIEVRDMHHPCFEAMKW